METEVGTYDGGRIDVVLINGDIKVACEISVTNTVDYEVQNIQKCIESGFSQVIMLSQNTEHLKLIQESANTRLSVNHINQVKFINTAQFVLILDSITSDLSNREIRIKGYRVKTSYNTQRGSKDATETVRKAILKALRKKESF